MKMVHTNLFLKIKPNRYYCVIMYCVHCRQFYVLCSEMYDAQEYTYTLFLQQNLLYFLLVIQFL